MCVSLCVSIQSLEAADFQTAGVIGGGESYDMGAEIELWTLGRVISSPQYFYAS